MEDTVSDSPLRQQRVGDGFPEKGDKGAHEQGGHHRADAGREAQRQADADADQIADDPDDAEGEHAAEELRLPVRNVQGDRVVGGYPEVGGVIKRCGDTGDDDADDQEQDPAPDAKIAEDAGQDIL